MPTITLQIKSQKITTGNVISAQELKDNYLFGIDIKKDGKYLPDSVYDFQINAAKAQVEQYLSLKIDLQIITENKDFHRDDWVSYGQVKGTYFVVCPLALQGFIGTTKQVDYPIEWITARKTSDGELYSRLIHVVPNNYSTYNQSAAIYVGLVPNAGWIGGSKHTPEYWMLKYITGFKHVPADIYNAIAMLASINVLTIGNETMASALGALGASSKSLSIDGLSESTSLYINGTTGIFGARIKQYMEQLFGKDGKSGMLKDLRDYYGNFVWGVN